MIWINEIVISQSCFISYTDSFSICVQILRSLRRTDLVFNKFRSISKLQVKRPTDFFFLFLSLWSHFKGKYICIEIKNINVLSAGIKKEDLVLFLQSYEMSSVNISINKSIIINKAIISQQSQLLSYEAVLDKPSPPLKALMKYKQFHKRYREIVVLLEKF